MKNIFLKLAIVGSISVIVPVIAMDKSDESGPTEVDFFKGVQNCQLKISAGYGRTFLVPREDMEPIYPNSLFSFSQVRVVPVKIKNKKNSTKLGVYFPFE